MHWHLSHRADRRALPLADRHYNRQNPGSPQFVPPASCLVLLTEKPDALWVTLAPIAEYVKHQWAGAWTCTLFRNESDHLASELITQAVAATRWWYEIRQHGAMEQYIKDDKLRWRIRWFDAPADRDQFVAATNGLRREPVVAPPPQGFVTFVDQKWIKPRNGRKHIPGYSYVKAGWEPVGKTTKAGLYALQLTPDRFPEPREPLPFIPFVELNQATLL